MGCRKIQSDVLVVGAGITGLRAAAEAAAEGLTVTIVSKGECASPEILGLNAPVMPDDSVEAYCEDTLSGGRSLNDSRLVRALAENVCGEIGWLEEHGVRFDRKPDGSYALLQTLGARCPRLVRSGVASGVSEMRVLLPLLRSLGVKEYRGVDILGLLYGSGRVTGAYGVDDHGDLVRFSASATVLATGGSGAIRGFTTYPGNLTGDGYAMAYDAGAQLMDMEFNQFEPCCLAWPESLKGKIMVTTLMRRGAVLRNRLGETFLENYGLDPDSVQKGELARAILREIRAGRGSPHGGVFFDLTMLSDEVLFDQHKLFTAPVAAAGIDLKKEMVEVVPASHTQLGGVIVEPDCSTNVAGLFACGEVSGGLHGANRIGGNAGAEVVVFGRIAGKSAAAFVGASPPVSPSEEEAIWSEAEKQILRRLGGDDVSSAAEIRRELDLCMSEKVGPFRDAKGLSEALDTIAALEDRLSALKFRNVADYARYAHCQHMLCVSRMQAEASALRLESRGVFYRSDYPEQDDSDWRKNILIVRQGDKMAFRTRDPR